MNNGTKEMVNHPDHYGGDSTYEVIKVLEAWNPLMAYYFCVACTIKYYGRLGKKDPDGVEDTRKAARYAAFAEEILQRHPYLDVAPPIRPEQTDGFRS